MERIKKSFSGVITGILLIIAGTVLLWWNEGNNVKNIQLVKYSKDNAIVTDSSKIDSNNDGKLIVTNGKVELTDEKVSDDLFGINVKTIALERKVEMYQWEEDEETDSDNHTTYHYKKVWSDDLINSGQFHDSGYKNPTSFAYNSKKFLNSGVKVGEYVLTDEQMRSLPTTKKYELTSSSVPELTSGYHVVGNYITNAENENNPNIGDIRISFNYNDYDGISVLAGQEGNKFVEFKAPNGGTIYRFEKGILDKEQMLKEYENDNNTLKWLLRLAGIVLVFFGNLLIAGPISTLSSFVPILGNIVGLAVGVIAFLVSIAYSFIIIAIAWIRFRPVLGISLIVAAIAAIITTVVIISKSKKKS